MAEMPIGRAVRWVRKNRGITQRELAKNMRVTGSYIGQAERGDRNITLRKLVSVSDALQIDSWRLLRIACRMNARLSL